MIMRKLLFALCLLLPVAAYAAPTIGQPAPDFTATAVDGKTVKLTDYKGSIVVLEWNNPDCPFVHKHYDSGNMQSTQSYAKSKNVIWLSINSGAPGKEGNITAAQAIDYIAKNKAMPTHYILDPSGTIGKLYGAKSTPHMFVIDAKGNLAYMGAIDNKATADSADIAKATNYVKAAIASLIAGKPVAMASTQSYGCSVKYEN
jgi:alkyl hydroperoxide reductase subunit AhpC